RSMYILEIFALIVTAYVNNNKVRAKTISHKESMPTTQGGILFMNGQREFKPITNDRGHMYKIFELL
ncbi:hypothetical protein ACJX0J_039828, partial [Zea mays]